MASSAPPPPQAPEDTLLADRYRLERRIGQGGMAEVWVATDTDLDRKVAVKWLKTNLAADPVVTERFRREAIAVARLTHPNIVAVHDVFVHQGRQAVVMQLVDGKSLRQLLDSQRRLGPELTIHLGAAIAGAMMPTAWPPGSQMRSSKLSSCQVRGTREDWISGSRV